jgi:hypothetical protein
MTFSYCDDDDDDAGVFFLQLLSLLSRQPLENDK